MIGFGNFSNNYNTMDNRFNGFMNGGNTIGQSPFSSLYGNLVQPQVNNQVGDYAQGLGADGSSDATQLTQKSMDQMRDMAQLQMAAQTEQGLIQMALKLNEALAKMFKALGDAVKGLVG